MKLSYYNILRLKVIQNYVDFSFRFQIDFIINVRLNPVTISLAILTHHNHGSCISSL